MDLLSLGRVPLANALLNEAQLAEPEKTYPLDLVLCPTCSLVQITETVPPDDLFRQYFYFSSFSDTMLGEAGNLAMKLVRERALGEDSLVVEVGSNDGYLLQFYQRAHIPVLGIEPAENVAHVAIGRQIPTVNRFFSDELARQLRDENGAADVIHANNVLAHVADLNGFVEGLGRLLHENGLAVIEVPSVTEMIDGCEFDTIYHEHLCYFSLTALDKLFRRHGLIIHDLEQLKIHGGTLRIYLGHEGNAVNQPSAMVSLSLEKERKWGVGDPESYHDFRAKIASLRDQLITLLRDLKLKGRRIAAYGAAAKGSTLLNYCGIGPETIEYIVDRSPAKQGRYMPGSHLYIDSPSRLFEDLPDYTLLLTWNFADEILKQQASYRQLGGKFIVPIPAPRIV